VPSRTCERPRQARTRARNSLSGRKRPERRR
jgi:hypothetical protein